MTGLLGFEYGSDEVRRYRPGATSHAGSELHAGYVFDGYTCKPLTRPEKKEA